MYKILSQQTFWISFLSILVIIVAAFLPGFTLDIPTLVGFVLVTVALLYKVSTDADLDPVGKWARLLKSPEFVAAVVGIILTTLNGFGIRPELGVTPEQLVSLLVVLAGYIFGESYRAKVYRMARRKQ